MNGLSLNEIAERIATLAADGDGAAVPAVRLSPNLDRRKPAVIVGVDVDPNGVLTFQVQPRAQP
jgi:hypothetical protein